MRFAAVVMICAIGSSAVAGEPITPAELAAVLEQWKVDLKFRSTFAYREGSATSISEVFDSRPVANVTYSATGVLAKSGPTIRYCLKSDANPVIVGVAGSDGVIDSSKTKSNSRSQKVIVSGASLDEVFDNDLLLAYTPKWENFNDRATFSRRTRSANGPRLNPSNATRISPLHPIAGTFGEFPGVPEGFIPLSEYRVEVSGGSQLALVGSSTNATEGKTSYKAEWTLEYGVPVIRRIQVEYLTPSGNAYVESRLSDFRPCVGAHMAAHVVTALWREGAGSVYVREWKSEDLGKTLPSDEDFAIQIPASTIVVGLASPIPPGTPRVLTLKGMSEAAVLPDGLSGPPPELSNGVGTWWFKLILVNLGVVVAILVYNRRRIFNGTSVKL